MPRTVSRWPRTSKISMAEIFSGLLCAKAAHAGSAARNWRRDWRIWRDYTLVHLDVVETGGLGAIGDTFDANHIAGPKRDAHDGSSRGRGAVHFSGRDTAFVRRPLVDDL